MLTALTLVLFVLVLAVFAGLFLIPGQPLTVLLARLVDDRGEVGEGDPSADEGADTDSGDGDDDPVEGEGDLADAGKKALDLMKSERNAARREARDLKRQLAATKPAAPPEGDQPDTEAIKAEARREANAAANERILRSEVKAAAAGKLTDPTDALRLLDLTTFEVDEDGNVDEAEIADAIDDLISKKPYLSAQGGKRFGGSGDGGTRKGSKTPSQLTRDQLKGMDPDEITKAKADGRLNDVLGIK